MNGNMNNNVYFETNLGKTTFFQKLRINYLFGGLNKVEWVSQIKLSAKREAEIESCFSTEDEFHYPHTVDELNELAEDLKEFRRLR